MTTQTSTRQVEPDITVYSISGRLTLGNALLQVESEVRKMIASGVRKLVIDLSNLQYIDSAGIGVLVGTAGEMEQQSGRLRIAGAQDKVRRTFSLVHIERLAAVDPDMETACRQLGSGTAAA